MPVLIPCSLRSHLNHAMQCHLGINIRVPSARPSHDRGRSAGERKLDTASKVLHGACERILHDACFAYLGTYKHVFKLDVCMHWRPTWTVRRHLT